MNTRQNHIKVVDIFEKEITIQVRDDEGESIPENMLSAMLLTGNVFLNSHWWEKSWLNVAQKTFSINILVNDVFYGGADAEEFTFDQLEEVFKFFETNQKWGLIIWVMKKRNDFELFKINLNDIEKDIGMTIKEFINANILLS